jgi:hypothetical protein
MLGELLRKHQSVEGKQANLQAGSNASQSSGKLKNF